MQEVAMDYKELFLGVGAAHSKLGVNVEQNYDRYKYWSASRRRRMSTSRAPVACSDHRPADPQRPQDRNPKVAILAEKRCGPKVGRRGAEEPAGD